MEKDRLIQVVHDQLVEQASTLVEENRQLENKLRQEMDERTTLLHALEERNNVLMAERASILEEKTKADQIVAVSLLQAFHSQNTVADQRCFLRSD